MTKQEATEFVKKLREAYPNPRKAVPGALGYCVGGSLCLLFQIQISNGYPTRAYVTEALYRANPKTISIGWQWAERIVHSNDLGEFEEAYKALEEALVYGSEEVCA